MSDVEDSNQAPSPVQPKILEQRESEKLKAKYPSLPNSGGGSAFLQKRLASRGPKFFDSGDYNMAKAKMNNPKRPLAAKEKLFLQESIGETIPTPDNLPPRKASIATSKLASGTLS